MGNGKPDWLKVNIRSGQGRGQVKEILERLSLNTVCKEANCPNLMECFCRKTATFMILGKVCTRNCTFCNVIKGNTENVDPEEPLHVAEAVKELELNHVVVTSVTRDDLPDGGAGHFVRVIEEIKKIDSTVTIEVLIPDFNGDTAALRKIVEAEPHIINHNIETVERLYPEVRPMASYSRSLELLKNVRQMNDSILTKSGIMVGLGEKKEEVIKVFEDLRSSGCNLLTVGQYLAPSKEHHPVVEYIHPDLFEEYKRIGLEMGFQFVASAPLVRSSYHADKVFEK
ncbi:MAG TPA: lipoyl synthase [Anaerovoracaceae bacterium]|nr:lipoyl synthase [Anaerovoracaceae bacterium]